MPTKEVKIHCKGTGCNTVYYAVPRFLKEKILQLRQEKENLVLISYIKVWKADTSNLTESGKNKLIAMLVSRIKIREKVI